MSSLSSYEGSERSVERRGVRSDLGSLDTSHTTETHTTTSVSVSTAATSIDTTRPGFFLPPPRDTDAWSVAATIDDQESVLSTNTQKSRVLYFDDHDQLGASSSSSAPPVPTANTTAAAAAAIGAAAIGAAAIGAGAAAATTTTTATATDATATMATTTATTTLGPSSSSSMTPVLTKALMMMDDTDDAGSVGNRSLASRSLVAEYGDRTTDGGFASDLSLANDDEDDEHSMDDRSPASSLITHATDPFPPHFHQLQHHNGIRQQRRRSSGAGQLPSPRRSLPHPIQNDHLSFVVAHSPISIDTNTQDTHTNASLHRPASPEHPHRASTDNVSSSSAYSHHHHHHHHDYRPLNVAVDDAIRAPTEPEPSIASLLHHDHHHHHHHHLHPHHPRHSDDDDDDDDMDSHRHRDHGTADDERPSRRQEEDDDDVPFGLDDLHGSHRRRDPEGSGSPTRHAPDHQGVDEKHPYERLVEENALLLSQLRCLELTTKHQQEIIANLQSHHQQPLLDLATDGMDATTTLAQQLMQWAELISVFSRQWTSQDQRWQVEKDLVQHMLEYFLLVLPFGTENQVLLNTAYRDQLSRFQKTLGPTFAKWYRQQTVQSLARNPASRDYLQAVRMLMTQHVTRVLEAADPTLLTASKEWQALLNQCTRLSLELHGGDHDVIIRNVAPGDSFDENTMTALDEKDESSENSSSGESSVKKDDNASSPSISPPPVPSSSMIRSPAAPLSLSPASSVVPVSSTAATVGSSSSTAAAAVATMNNNSKRVVKTMISPIFLNDNDIVLLPARVILA